MQPSERPTEYTIDELARAANTTVRNVRAYQDRGLLPPPERRGRNGVFHQTHLSRLRIIGQLLARGYTLNSISELLEAWEKGQNIGELLGLEAAVSSPWTDEVPAHYTLTELLQMFNSLQAPVWLTKALQLGIVQLDGTKFIVPSPRMLYAGAELTRVGIPLDEMLDVVSSLRQNVERAADDMVRLFEKYIFDPYGTALPPTSEIPRLGDIIWRLRPLVEMAVHAEVARAMQIAASQHLGDRLGHIMEEMKKQKDKDSEG